MQSQVPLGSITTNKASGGDGIPVELFQILKGAAAKVLYSIRQHIWKTQQWPQDWKRSDFIPVRKKGNAKECSNYFKIAFIPYVSKLEKEMATHSSVLAWRKVNNLRYANDTTLMAESEEELKSFLMKLKEESEKAGLKFNIQKSKIMASGPITSWHPVPSLHGKDGGKMETVIDYFLGLQNHCGW